MKGDEKKYCIRVCCAAIVLPFSIVFLCARHARRCDLNKLMKGSWLMPTRTRTRARTPKAPKEIFEHIFTRRCERPTCVSAADFKLHDAGVMKDANEIAIYLSATLQSNLFIWKFGKRQKINHHSTMWMHENSHARCMEFWCRFTTSLTIDGISGERKKNALAFEKENEETLNFSFGIRNEANARVIRLHRSMRQNYMLRCW